MKNTLLFFMLMLSGIAGAQIVNIPDPEFKEFLTSNQSYYYANNSAGSSVIIDANNDNEIQISEALAVWELVIGEYYGEPIDTMTTSVQGIEAFTNIRKLHVDLEYLSSLDVTAL